MSGCLEPEQIAGEWEAEFSGRGSSPHIEARFRRGFGSGGAILEASDWLFRAKGHLPGRGGGPRALRGWWRYWG